MSEFDPQSETLADLERQNQERIAGWWDLVGQAAAYPVGSDTVVKLLRAVEYACDNDKLLQAVNDGWIPPVARQAGRLAWSASSTVSLACALEARRAWLPFSKIHGHKLTLAEKLVQLNENDGQAAIPDLAEFDIAGLLGLLVAIADDGGAVRAVAEAIRQRLRMDGVVF
jgi:hypothetical protein